ncbi:MAG: adenosine kinase [Chitinispirillaceae bacterium]
MIIPTTQPNRNKVAAIGSALMDLCLLESDDFLLSSGAQKGGMVIADHTHITSVLSKSGNKPSVVPGGSACNTIVGIGKLGGNARFIGKRGDDELGRELEQSLKSSNVEPFLLSSKSPTGHVLSIVTPDAQRSMLTYLGASSETLPEEISADHFEDSVLVHIEGYLLFNPQLLKASLRAAKKAGAFVSLDLASYTIVEESRELLEEIMSDYVDILIANEDEAAAFTGFRNKDEAISSLAKQAQIAVVKVGKKGSLIAHKGKIHKIAACGSGEAIDTTGAGDLWASGFLYGLVKGYDIETCGNLGSQCGYEVCQVLGADIPDEGWARVKKLLPTDSRLSS